MVASTWKLIKERWYVVFEVHVHRVWINETTTCQEGRVGKARGQCWGWGCGTDTRSSKLSHSHLQTHASSRRWARRALLLPVVAELDGGTLEDTAEGDWLDLPVRHGVAEQADAGVHGLLAVNARRTEVSGADGGDLVDMEVDHLRERIWIITSFSRWVGCAW